MKATSRDPALAVDGLTVRYGESIAVDGVSLSLESGELMVIVGPSGSGKSTFLLAIAGLIDQPDAAVQGRIELAGKDVSQWPPNRRKMPMVFQSFALFPHLSILENTAFPLRVSGLPKSRTGAVAEECLKSVHLNPALYARRPQEISGGEQQRVALARALAANALPGASGIILMDEPLGSLDRQLRLELQEEIKQLQRSKGLTMLYVTHDQTEGFRMGDRLAVFQSGRVAQVGSAGDIYGKPETEFVARFFGDSNILEGVIDAINSEEVEISLPGSDVKIKSRFTRQPNLGDHAKALVRPERISLGKNAAGNNGLRGTIHECLFLGDRWEVTVFTSSGQRMCVSQVGAGHLAELAIGQEVAVMWSSEETILLNA